MSVCGECSVAGHDCCHQTAADDPDCRFGLTLDDVRRIRDATGMRPAEFIEVKQTPVAIRKAMEERLPGFSRQFPEGVRLGLRFTGPEGACVFWRADKGCTLDLEVRPRTCALYPSWYVRTGPQPRALAWVPFALAPAARCLAVERAGGAARRLLHVLSTTEEQLTELMLFSDAELDRHAALSLDAILEQLEALR